MASLTKSLKIFFRDRTIVGSSIMIPTVFLIIVPLMLYQDVPTEFLSGMKGALSVSMMTLLIMSACIGNLAGSVAADAKRGLYAKLSSMPVKAWHEGFGRVLSAWFFCLLGSAILILFGFGCGATFTSGFYEILGCLFLGLTIAASSTGIGLVIAAFVKGESAATHIGIGISMLIYFASIAMPYSMIPSFLQVFSRINPISAANNMIIFLLEGEAYAGYNPFSFVEVSTVILLSLGILVAGLLAYSRFCWTKR
ncbi:MAG: ABC transporter permease [Candidatus Thorarchaeota archaeon]